MTDTENTFGGFTLLDDEEEFDVSVNHPAHGQA